MTIVEPPAFPVDISPRMRHRKNVACDEVHYCNDGVMVGTYVFKAAQEPSEMREISYL